MYRNVLIPTDGSDAALAAIEEGVGLARLAGATVHGLYVVDTRDYNTLPESKWISQVEDLEAEGEAATDDVREAAADAGVEAVTSVSRGVPHEEILRYVADNDVDLIVMATHGRTGLDRFLLGSVTEKIIRRAPVPVHVVRVPDADGRGIED
ncbi:MAG: universal stress protein [Haloarculaceae archaeon]